MVIILKKNNAEITLHKHIILFKKYLPPKASKNIFHTKDVSVSEIGHDICQTETRDRMK